MDDSFTFSSMICQLLPCVGSQFMVSFDITSLFSNVPLDEVISICAEFLYQSLLTSVPFFPESVFVEPMELATKSVSFSFNDTVYHERNFNGFSIRPYSCKYFLGSMKNYSLTGFPSLVFIYITWTILSPVSSSGGMIYILL